MADITGAWRACLGACKRPGGGGMGGVGGVGGGGSSLMSPAMPAAPPPPPLGSRRVADPIMQQAQEVVRDSVDLEENSKPGARLHTPQHTYTRSWRASGPRRSCWRGAARTTWTRTASFRPGPRT